ncbi:MAG: J domain-containing protein [Myxococcota bacterium]
MTTFAEHLQAAMHRREAPAPRTAPLTDSLRAFENALGGLGLSSQVLETNADCRWAAALGLTLPCTVRDVKRAFRRLAFQTHPDRPGGSHSAFLEAQALLQQALRDLENDRPSPQGTPLGRPLHAWTAAPSPARTTLHAYA